MLNGVADAQTTTTTPSSSSSSDNATEDKPDCGHRRGTPLTGEDLEKAKAAALEAVPGATFKGAHKAPDGTIHAHVIKEDGTHVHVAMDENFKVTKVEDAPDRPHRHGPRGPRGPRPGDTTPTTVAY